MKACIPVIPSIDLEKSLRFWVDGVGLIADRHMHQDGKLIGCMVHDQHLYFWLNQRSEVPASKAYEGIRLYWTPDDIYKAHAHLKAMGFEVSGIEARHYGQTEFFMTDDDGHAHCFGVDTNSL